LSRGHSLWFAVIVEQGCGDHDQVVANGELMVELAERYGMVQIKSIGNASQGRALIDLGQTERGFGLLRTGVAAMDAAQYNSAYALYFRFLLAEALAQSGNWSEAALLAERVLSQLDASGQGFFRPDYLRLRGDCLVGLRGAADAQAQAEPLYREAV